MVRQNKTSSKVNCYFLSNRLQFKAKFHTLIACSCVHKLAKRHLILSYCCKVAELFARQHRDSAHSKT